MVSKQLEISCMKYLNCGIVAAERAIVVRSYRRSKSAMHWYLDANAQTQNMSEFLAAASHSMGLTFK